MSSTFLSVLPPVIAIFLALITKEVYLSLLAGILTGALLFTNFQPIAAVETTFQIMGDKIGTNADILIFLVLLGILVALITKSGASKAYGSWACAAIKSKRGALLATSCLGMMIFVDDYFNCLTVGCIMRPVTDRFKISRAKLAYIIDSTAAPVCIIAPISSWAAAVGSSLPKASGIDGFSLFLKTIPFNFYALFTIVFVLFIILTGLDFSKMADSEENHVGRVELLKDQEEEVGEGKVIDLVLPILFLILSCVLAMLYTGNIMQGVGIISAFANCSSAKSLVIGSFFTIVFTFILYIPRKIIRFADFCECFIKGFQAMTPAIMILCLAWTLSGICSESYLNIGGYVSTIIQGNTLVTIFLPALFFLVALGLAFATGTSWGTFGILIPIALAVFGMNDMLSVCVAAILSGAVCGDHISPISDTTILSSAGAQCNHIEHVTTQIPYALTVSFCAFTGFLTAGIASNGFAGLLVGIIMLIVSFMIIVKRAKRR